MENNRPSTYPFSVLQKKKEKNHSKKIDVTSYTIKNRVTKRFASS